MSSWLFACPIITDTLSSLFSFWQLVWYEEDDECSKTINKYFTFIYYGTCVIYLNKMYKSDFF